jgi:hypothetical protein
MNRLLFASIVATSLAASACSPVVVDENGHPIASGSGGGNGAGGGGGDAHPDAPASACAPVKLAENQGDPQTIRADTTHVYWLAQDGDQGPWVIRRAPICGGPVETISKQAGPFVLDGDDLYALVQGPVGAEILRMPKQGGAAVKIAETTSEHAIAPASTIAIDADNVYFTVDGPPVTCLMRVAKSGGFPQPLVCDGMGVWDITLSEDSIWWSNNESHLLHIPKAGGVPVLRLDLSDQTGDVTSFALDGDTVYAAYLDFDPDKWGDYKDHARIARYLADGTSERLYANAKSGWAFAITLDATSLYFAVEDDGGGPGTIGCTSKGGAGLHVLSTEHPGLSNIVVDDRHLYFGTTFGEIWQVPK